MKNLTAALLAAVFLIAACGESKEEATTEVVDYQICFDNTHNCK